MQERLLFLFAISKMLEEAVAKAKTGVDKISKYTLRERFLKEDYPHRNACKLAAFGNVSELVADAVDAEKTQTIANKISTIAMMKCLGLGTFAIVAYIIGLVITFVTCVIFVMRSIPDDFWKNCQICEEYETDANKKTGATDNCRKYRPGTPKECKATGFFIEGVIALVAASIVVTLIWNIVRFYLRARIFKFEAFVGMTGAELLV